MFGLEGEKKKPEEFVFDLEAELKSEKKHKEIIELVENRIQKIKDVLRGGGEKEEFEKYGILLHGYTSLLKVSSRIPVKK